MTIRENDINNYTNYECLTQNLYSNGQLDNNQYECTVANVFQIGQGQDNRVDTTSKSIRNWTKSEFLNWIATELMNSHDETDIVVDLSLENFYKLTQDDLTKLLNNMDVNEFEKHDPEYGKFMHKKLLEYENKTVLNRVNSCASYDSSNTSDNSMSDTDSLPFIPTSQHNLNSDFIRNSSFNGAARIKDGKIIKLNQQTRNEKKTKDCVHVWQFCRDLLKDPNYNPQVIEWVDKKLLIFKISAKEQIAYLWGLKKNRKNPEKMTYENMSRGMRHSRVASDYFRIPDKKYKKKFVYQFGDKAIENCDYLKSLKCS